MSSNSNNNSPNCFPNPSSCLYHDGETLEGFIEQGDTQTTVNNSLASKLKELENRVDSCSLCGGSGSSSEGGTDNSSIKNVNILNSSNYSIPECTANYSFAAVSSTVGVAVTYDVTPSFVGLSGQIVRTKVYVDGLKNGFPSRIFNGSSNVGGFTLPVDSFPAIFYAEVSFQSTAGSKTFTSQINLNALGQSYNPKFCTSSTTQSAPETQSEVNQVFDDQISSLKNSVNNLQSFSLTIDGQEFTSIQDAMMYMSGELSKLKTS